MEKSHIVWAADSNEVATIVKCVIVLALLAAVIIFSVSMVGKETRDAYNKVNVVPVEDGNVWR